MANTKKIFRALTDSVVEKQFIGANEDVPTGWYATAAEALAVAKPEEPVTITEHDAKKPRGRASKKAPLPSIFGVSDGDGTDDN